MQLIIISGLAGAGKSSALKILEDSDYYCVDNLPPPMLLQLITIHLADSDIKKIAVVVDTRSHNFLRQLPLILDDLIKLKIAIKIIYLDAQTEMLIKRFAETRRKHPLLNQDDALIDCINKEREILLKISDLAYKIDTSNLTISALAKIIKQSVGIDDTKLNITLQSFGFKYGIPIDADFIFDVRCLINPYYDKLLRPLTGLDMPVIRYLQEQTKASILIDDIYQYLKKWLEEFKQENRNYITVAIGCTGGKHRSVFVATQLAQLLHQLQYAIIIRHRQILINEEI